MSETEKTDPFELGRDAYRAGVALNENPYPEDSDDAIDWEGGWMYEEEDQ